MPNSALCQGRKAVIAVLLCGIHVPVTFQPFQGQVHKGGGHRFGHLFLVWSVILTLEIS